MLYARMLWRLQALSWQGRFLFLLPDIQELYALYVLPRQAALGDNKEHLRLFHEFHPVSSGIQQGQKVDLHPEGWRLLIFLQRSALMFCILHILFQRNLLLCS